MLGVAGIMIGIVLYPVLNVFAASYLWRRAPRLMPFLVYPLFYLVVFSAAAPLMFRWYYTPPMPAWIFGAVVGAWSLVELAGRRANTRWLYPGSGSGAAWPAWGGSALNHWTLTPDHGPSPPRATDGVA